MSQIQQSANIATTATQVQLTPSSLTSNSTLTVHVVYATADQRTVTVTDTRGHTYNRIVGSAYHDGSTGMETFTVIGATAGADTVTAAISGAASAFVLGYMREDPNADAATLLGATTVNLQVSPAVTTDTVTSGNFNFTSQPGWSYGFSFDANGLAAPAAGTGYTSRTAVWDLGGGAVGRPEDKRLTATGNNAATWTSQNAVSALLSIQVAYAEPAGATIDPGVITGSSTVIATPFYALG